MWRPSPEANVTKADRLGRFPQTVSLMLAKPLKREVCSGKIGKFGNHAPSDLQDLQRAKFKRPILVAADFGFWGNSRRLHEGFSDLLKPNGEELTAKS